jgi:5'-nucleotidase
MPLDLSDTLSIGISATALFDMSMPDDPFRKLSGMIHRIAKKNYRKCILQNEDAKQVTPLEERPFAPLLKKFSAITTFHPRKFYIDKNNILKSEYSDKSYHVCK